MTNLIEQLIAFLRQYDGINDKAKLEIYFEVLRIFEQDLFDEKHGGVRTNRFICHTFHEVLGRLGVEYLLNSNIEEFFKEFFDLYDGMITEEGHYYVFEQNKNRVSVQWWPGEEKEARIRTLNFIISNRIG